MLDFSFSNFFEVNTAKSIKIVTASHIIPWILG